MNFTYRIIFSIKKYNKYLGQYRPHYYNFITKPSISHVNIALPIRSSLNLYLYNIAKNNRILRVVFGSFVGTLFIAYGESLKAEGNDEIIKKADHFYDNLQFEDIYELLLPLKDAKNSDILWRLARALYEKAKCTENTSEKKKYYGDALEYLKEAERINSSNFAVQKWLAIIIDSYYSLDGIKSRISHLYETKKHMEKACELKPNDGTCWHILGVWYFGIADISWYERKIASVFFATPPQATYEDALQTFLHAEKVDPNFYSKNYLMIGKCLSRLGRKEEAKSYLLKAKDYPQKTIDDEQAKTEAENLLKNL